MKKEKIFLFLTVILIALVVSALAFYLYQKTREIPTTKIKKIAVLVPTPTPKPSIFISVSNPTDESVTNKTIVTISGKTVPGATVTALSPVDQSSGLSSSEGDFSMTINIDTDQNLLKITAIAPNGETTTKQIVITSSTESF